MIRNEITDNASKDAGMTKVQDENAIPSMLPYYCGWYRIIFFGQTGRTDREQEKPAREVPQS
jgi:hypothetical protein